MTVTFVLVHVCRARGYDARPTIRLVAIVTCDVALPFMDCTARPHLLMNPLMVCAPQAAVTRAAAGAGAGGRVSFVGADLMKEADVVQLARDAAAAHGRVDIVVNNAGTVRTASGVGAACVWRLGGGGGGGLSEGTPRACKAVATRGT